MAAKLEQYYGFDNRFIRSSELIFRPAFIKGLITVFSNHGKNLNGLLKGWFFITSTRLLNGDSSLNVCLVMNYIRVIYLLHKSSRVTATIAKTIDLKMVSKNLWNLNSATTRVATPVPIEWPQMKI